MKASVFFKRSVAICLIAFVFTMAGCKSLDDTWFADVTRIKSYSFLDPSKVIRADRSPVNPIYNTMGEADSTEELPPNATFPEEEDLSYVTTDYVIGPSDILAIYIMDLYETNMETVVEREVSASGFIDLPQLPEPIRAEGYTKEQLTDVIKQAYSPDIIRNPNIAVRVAVPKQNTFSILGAVGAPGTYNIIRKDMRLLQALAMARGFTQENIRYLYVIRPKPAIKVEGQTPQADQGLPELPKAIAPVEEKPTQEAPIQEEPQAKPQETQPAFDAEAALKELGAALPGAKKDAPKTAAPKPTEMLKMTDMQAVTQAAVASAKAAPQADQKSEKWVYSGGKWIRVVEVDETPVEVPSAKAAPVVVTPAPKVTKTKPAVESKSPAVVVQKPIEQPKGVPAEKIPAVKAPAPVFVQPPKGTKKERMDQMRDPYNWQNTDASDLARVIAVNIDRLRNGDPRMNIVVRDGDIIQIPPIKPGEFYVMGEVSRPGPYTLAGRQITVKMALGAAGNLGPLAWPEHSVLIRRIGNDQEQILPIDVAKIFAGKEPDFFLKPNDVLAIGTNWRTSFLAVIRNAFRMTYGFGLIYDRNFSEPIADFERYNSGRFRRW